MTTPPFVWNISQVSAFFFISKAPLTVFMICITKVYYLIVSSRWSGNIEKSTSLSNVWVAATKRLKRIWCTQWNFREQIILMIKWLDVRIYCSLCYYRTKQIHIWFISSYNLVQGAFQNQKLAKLGTLSQPLRPPPPFCILGNFFRLRVF